MRADNAAGQIDTDAQAHRGDARGPEIRTGDTAAGQSRLAAGTSTTFEVLQFQRDLAVSEAAELGAPARIT